MHITTLRRHHSILIFADAGTIWHLNTGQVSCQLPGQLFDNLEVQQQIVLYEGASFQQTTRGLIKLTALRDSEILQQAAPVLPRWRLRNLALSLGQCLNRWGLQAVNWHGQSR